MSEDPSVSFSGTLTFREETPGSSLTEDDLRLGDALAGTAGDTWIDFRSMTPTEQWARIAKILRFYGVGLQVVVQAPSEKGEADADNE